MMASRLVLGEGTSVFATAPLRGRVRWFRTPADVVLAEQDSLDDVIAFVEYPGVAFLAPILGDLTAVVCTSGSPDSHLALVALEHGVPCVVEATVGEDLEDDTIVRLEQRSGRRAKIVAEV